jgi:hypothetical protein
MDVERSKTMDVAISADAKGLTAHERNMSYTHRRQAAAQIKARVQAIMDELDGVVAAKPHTAEEQAAAELSHFIKGQRFRDGKLLISYIDGTSHEGIQELTAYNDHCRRRLMEVVATNEAASKILIPDEADFATTSLFSVAEERMALSSMRRPSAASVPEEDEDPLDTDRYMSKKKELTEREDELKSKYNERATATSRYLQSFPCIRDAELEYGFEA